MKYIYTLISIWMLVASMVYAGTDVHNTLYTGVNDFQGTLKIDGTTVTATADEINSAADMSARITTASVTNGETLTLSANTPVIEITGINNNDDDTNTITLGRPYPANVEFTIIVNSTSTNLIKITNNTSVVALGSDWIGDNTDTIVLYSLSTNSIVKLSSSDN